MKKWMKILLTLFVIGIIAAAGVWYWAKLPPATAADSKPVAVFTSAELVKKMNEGYKLIDSTYMKKNIGIDGKIKSVDAEHYNIIIDGGESAEIVCTFDSAMFVKNMTTVAAGNTIKLKGIYSGSQGFETPVAPAGEMDLLDAVMQSNKTINLRTCALNQ